MDKMANRIALQNIARKAMIARGLEPDFPETALDELKSITNPATYKPETAKDLRDKLWCSIDNADSLDLDQLSYAEALPENKVRLFIAIADVDALVVAQSNIDIHANKNTTSIYTVAQLYPMLPEKLSTDLTSLRFGVDRCAVVVEMIIGDRSE